jgi:anaerobic selenocysteine-containing dehydrogenase
LQQTCLHLLRRSMARRKSRNWIQPPLIKSFSLSRLPPENTEMPQTPATEIRPSVCPLDCPDTCSLSVQVADEQIIAVKGSRANPFTEGVICKKVAKYYPDFVHGPRRLRTPLLRVGPRGGDEFVPISWDEALDRVHAGFSAAIQQHGPQSVLPLNYAGPHGQLAMGSMDYRFFHKLGATQLDRAPLCGGVRAAAYASLFGGVTGLTPEAARESELIVVWGSNITTANLHFQRVIKAARECGGKLVVIDPVRIKSARNADLFLQVRPGTDVVLALAMAAEFARRGLLDHDFIARWVNDSEAYLDAAQRYSLADAAEICGLALADIEAFVALYATAKSVAMTLGVGLERGASGGSAHRAAMTLQVLTGNIGKPAAGIIGALGAAFPKTPEKLRRPDFAPAGTRAFNIVDVAQHLLDDTLDPPIRATLIYNHNPVCTHPDQNRMIAALSREELFTVGCDVVMTDSMRYCDVILPACSHFEHDDLFTAYGTSWLQRAKPVIPPVGEALPNTEIFRRLAARFGFDDPAFRASDAELMADAVDAARLGQSPSELPTDSALEMRVDNAAPQLCANLDPATPSGRIELYSADFETRFGCGLPEYRPMQADRPFVLLTPASVDRTNATFGGHPAGGGPEPLEIHPDDAQTHGISDRDLLRVWNQRGEVVLRAVLSEAMQPGVLCSPKGAWLRSSASGRTTNALITADMKADIIGGAVYNETFVEIEAWAG